MPQSPKLQRLTTMAVPALLAANAMVLALGLHVMDDATPATAGEETVTYIQEADGTLRAVDPATPEGARAIADANERGEQVQTVPASEQPAEVLQQGTQPTTTLVPGLTAPVDDLLDQTESTVIDTLDQLGDTIDGVVEDVTGIVDDNAGTNLGGTINPIVDETTDTLTTTVSTVVADTRSTATTVVDSAPVDTPPPPASTPAPEPVAEVVPSSDAPTVSVGGTELGL